MKLLLVLILTPFAFFGSKVSDTSVASQNFHFELTVNSASEDTARFDLLIIGVSLTELGEQKSFRKQHSNLKTPYKLILEEGKYTAVIETKEGTVLSKSYGVEDGIKVVGTIGSQRIATLHFDSLGRNRDK